MGDASIRGRASIRRLALARALSGGGSQAAQVALAYRVYQETSSAAWVSAALVASAGVVGIFGPISGRLSDRYDRRRLMVISELAAAIGWLAVVFVDAPVLLVLGALAATAANAPFRSASAAAVPNLVDPGDLTWANATLGAGSNTALVVGPLIGGALVGVVGARWVFGLDALSFVASAALIAGVRGAFSEVDRSGHPSAEPIDRSWRTLLVEPRRRLLYAVTALSFAAFGVIVVADLPLVAHLHGGPIGYALLTTLWGVGSLGGSWTSRRLPAGSEHRTLVAGTLAMAVSIGSIAVLPDLALVIAVGMLGGFGAGLVFTVWSSLLQRTTGDHERGTAFAIAETFEQSCFIAGMVGAGGVVALVGPQATYVVPAVLLLAACAAARGLQHRSVDP